MANIPYPEQYDDSFMNIFKRIIDELNLMGYTYEESLQKAREILDEAQQTNDMNTAVNERLDNIIADSGTSSTEVVDARGSYTVLNQRLDQEFGERLKKNVAPLYLSDYGVSISNTKEQNTLLIQQAFDEAGEEGRPVILPWTGEEYIEVDGRLKVHKAIKITGYGKQTKFLQHAKDKTFCLRAEGTHLSEVYIEGVTGDEHGVYITSDFSSARGIYLNNLTDGVRISSTNPETSVGRQPIRGANVFDIEATDVNFAFVVESSRDLVFGNIRGSYKLKSPKSPHLVYLNKGSADDVGQDFGNFNVMGSDCSSFDGGFSFAYQFRDMRGGRISNIVARNSAGILNVMGSKDFTVTGITSIDDNNDYSNIGSIDIDGPNENVRISDFDLVLKNNAKGARMGDETKNCIIENGKIRTFYTSSDVGYVAELRGDSNTFNNIDVVNAGTATAEASIGIWGGNNHEIRRPVTKGNASGIKVKKGNNNKIVDFDYEKLQHTPSSGSDRKIEVSEIAGETFFIPLDKNTNGLSEKNRLIAYDRFDKPSGSVGLVFQSSSGHEWTWARGNWIGDGNSLHSEVANNSIAYITLDTPDVDFSGGIKVKNRESLVVRVVSSDTFIGLKLNQTNDTVQIFKRIDGAETVLEEYSTRIQVGRRYKIGLKVFNDQVDGYLEGEKVLSHTLDTSDMSLFGEITNHGLYGNGEKEGKFDNLEWRKID